LTVYKERYKPMTAHNKRGHFLIAASMAVAVSVLALTTLGIPGGQANAAPVGKTKKGTPHVASQTSIVLVHGAFADGSGWSEVIPLLDKDGYTVTAVQNPLTSIADDIATTKRVIDAQKGPIVVVGHSYGGAVITGAAAGNANVKALVYVSAFAPDEGEKLTAGTEKFSQPPLNSALVADSAGFLYVDRAKFHEDFCADLPAAEARVMAATQKPLSGTVFDATVSGAAWRSVPSWYIVGTEDHAINPDFERFLAKRMGAKTTEIKSSHVSFLSQPTVVVKVIEEAAKAAEATVKQP
jgi:pimeloyl-ACP methyl ester carboxylesterase